MANQVAERVAAKHPDVMLGFLAYVQFTRPPLREKLHPNLYPQVAPISYSRAHPMTNDNVPGNKDLRYLVEGWGRAAPAVSYYLYTWFLAEANAPNPLITKWSTDIPILYRNHCQFWQPEGITNFETSMHGIYLGLRMAWIPNKIRQRSSTNSTIASMAMPVYRWPIIGNWSTRSGWTRPSIPDAVGAISSVSLRNGSLRCGVC